ncbi:uncharacterized protein BKA55DRAFT_580887 [Fusarium redolens]|uniref:Uncharacterized protein n=1 Tax=Fusarium redolens TaxID=48865 RepID=A0A9P9G331_FUSRE|nr:uncharacterized protein BKA55DRAFT_580887 [Fusarium redolens]KAH7232255.1 hypothetical protein BKA55DRAFT_580887 [Fusarium redolens]
MESSNLNFDSYPPLYPDSGLALDTQLSMYQYPCPDAEANNWTLPTIPHKSPPVVFSWLYMPTPLAYSHIHQSSAASAVVFPSYPIINWPYQTGSFSYGEWPQNLTGVYPKTDYGLSSLQCDSGPQQVDQNPFQQASGQCNGTVAPWSTAEHFGTIVAEAPTTETQALNCLCPKDRFLVDCRLKGMEWTAITAEYNKRWKPKTAGALTPITTGYNKRRKPKTASGLRAQLCRIAQKHPVIKRILKPRSRKAPKPS